MTDLVKFSAPATEGLLKYNPNHDAKGLFSAAQNAFMKDYHEHTHEDPLGRPDRLKHVPGPNDGSSFALLHVSPVAHSDEIHMHSIQALAPRKGQGTAGLKWVSSLADKHGLALSGTAKAYGDRGMSTTKLKTWYAKHGFSVKRDGTMIRRPQSAKNDATTDLIKFNQNHEPKGSSIGGQFASGTGGAGSSDDPGLHRMYDRLSQPDGGFTYQPKTGVEPTEGFAVSIYPQHSFAKEVKSLTPNDLAKYYHDHVELFQKNDHFIGAWHDPASGKAFLDVSVVAKTAAEAKALALGHDQIAYFDLKAGQSVTVNKEATSGGVAKGDFNGRREAYPYSDARQGYDAGQLARYVPPPDRA